MGGMITLEIKDIPHSDEIEQQVLGNIFINDKKMRDIIDLVKAKRDFFNELHQEIFKAMVYLFHSNLSISYESIFNRLKYKEILNDEVVDYILQIGNCVSAPSTFESYVEMLLDIARKRELYLLYKKRLTTDISGITSSNLVKEIEEKIEGMGITSNIELDRFQDYIDDWVTGLEDNEPVQTYKMGFKLLDDIIILEPTNLMLIGARPSVGKSAFATNIVKNFCLQDKKPLFVSLEMNKKEFMNRLVSNMAHVEARKIKRKEGLTTQDWNFILDAKEKIKKFKFNFYDKGGMKVEQLLGLCRHLKKKDNLDVLVIDYLQLLETNQFKGQKQNQVGYISQKLKQLAMELEIPVIALSQLNRGVTTDSGNVREPQLSDLRDSGSLEQDSNIVVMLHTDDIEQKYQDKKFLKLFIRKNRDGRLGVIDYTYFGDYVEFKEVEWVDKKPVFVEQEDLSKSNIEILDEDLPF